MKVLRRRDATVNRSAVLHALSFMLKKAPIKELIKKYSKDFFGTLNDKQVIGVINSEGLSVSRNTYYKYKREIVME